MIRLEQVGREANTWTLCIHIVQYPRNSVLYKLPLSHNVEQGEGDQLVG